MPRCTGIQISDRTLRAVELRGGAKNPVLVRYTQMTLPTGGEGSTGRLGSSVSAPMTPLIGPG